MPLKKLSLRAKTIIFVAVFMLVTNMALGTVLMHQMNRATKTQINERMLDIVNTAAAMLDGDSLGRLTAEDKGTPEYDAAMDTLVKFRDNINLEYIYYVREEEDGSFTFGIDTDPVDPGEFGSPVVYTDALKRASEGTPAVDEEPYEDKWGRFYSAFSPVFDSKGEVAAIVTADFNAKWLEDQIAQNRRTVLVACLIFMLISMVITFLLTGQYSREMQGIRSNLNDLAEDMESLTMEYSGGKGESIHADFRTDNIQELGKDIAELRDTLRDYVTHSTTQANSMITAMASDYRAVYYVNLDEDEGVCWRSDPNDSEQSEEGNVFPFHERFTWYGDHYVTESYREGFMSFIDPGNIREALLTQPIIGYRYLANRDGHEYYEMIRMAGVRRLEDRDDNMVHAIGLGLTVIDEEMRETLAKNEALAEALELAESASKAKTAFLSNMSHEIRTPMNAIIGLDTIALKDPAIPEHTRDELEKIGASAKHLLSLINDILDMSRIESGQIVLRQEEFSFSGMLDQINTMVTSQCADKGLDFECRVLSDMDDYYIGDDMKLKEVLINILSNAIKFTDAPGSVTLSVEKTASFGDQSTLRFRIKDTGIGMDAEYIPKIFEAFSQEDSSRKTKYGSTGLGMAITRSIVDMMNGTISVESEKGKGTEFTVVVTLKTSERKDDDIEMSMSAAAETETACTLAGRRVLLAEDMEINAEILTDILEMEEIEADHAWNGREAVDMFAASEPGTYSAVLMDIRMPEMDGLEAATAIRALDRADAKKIPVIALTANAFDEDVQRSLQAGMNAHLTKPVEPDVLYRTLEELISKEKMSS